MSRAYRYATIGLIWIFAIIIHWFGITLFAPETVLWGIADGGVGTYVDDDWRGEMYLIFAQAIPLMFVGLSALWGFAKEYEDAANTGVVR